MDTKIEMPIKHFSDGATQVFSVNGTVDFSRIKVKVKKLSETATIPTYGSAQAACCDLYADILSMNNNKNNSDQLVIYPNDTIKIPTGLSFELPKGMCALIFARSGLATKHGLRPGNCVGVCDEDYRGNYTVALHNDSDYPYVITHGERIAQMMIVPYIQADFEQVDELSETERGDEGFGSTGTN